RSKHADIKVARKAIAHISLSTIFEVIECLNNASYANILPAMETSIEMTEDCCHYFVRELFKLIMTRVTRLTHIAINSFPECFFTPMILFYSCILKSPFNFISTLSHITTLDLGISDSLSYILFEISTHCTKISSLSLRSRHSLGSSYDLSQLIKRQRSLRHLHLEEITVTSKLIDSLRFHTTTLESLTLMEVIIDNSRALWNLSSCSRLKTLIIHFLGCYPCTYDGLKPLWSFHFPEICKFKLIGRLHEHRRESLADNTCSFLEKNGKSLNTLSLDINPSVYCQVLQKVSEKCIQLKKLTVRGYKHDSSLEKMLKDTSMELKWLKVEQQCHDYYKLINNQLFDAHEFPPLKELRGAKWLRHLDFHMCLDADSVERLLDDWEAPLERIGYLYKYKHEEDRHHEVLRKFAHKLDEGLQRRQERRQLHKIDLFDSLCVWNEIMVRKMEMYIEYVDD
ncbi:12248_t:CDS:2, partial [Acaulospora morrowiae]